MTTPRRLLPLLLIPLAVMAAARFRVEVYLDLFVRMSSVHQRMYAERMSLATP